ncbi:MAG: hypothetical protein NTY20_00095 [Candidatus Aenigmarchaeota archaeon]|nr:hypothetical protein [Candidatus Aenigmarchaeota archaeon]
MKALSTTILIVVTAVVILVAALVVLTIFGGGVGNVAEMTKLRNNCIIQCTMTCTTMGSMPPTWSAIGCDKAEPTISHTTDCKCKCESGQVWCEAKKSCATPADCIK